MPQQGIHTNLLGKAALNLEGPLFELPKGCLWPNFRARGLGELLSLVVRYLGEGSGLGAWHRREENVGVAHVEWGRGREGAQMKLWVGLERFRQAMALWPALQKRHWGFAWRGDWRTQRGSGKVGYEGCSSPRDRWGSHGLRVQRWRRRETGKLDRYLSSSEDVSACHMAAVNGGPGQ